MADLTHALGTIDVGDDGVAVLTMAMAGRINKIDEAYIRGWLEALDWLGQREGLSGIIVATAHKDWCVGADLDMIFPETDPARILEATTLLGGAYRKLETMGVPVVAALTGSALGGGYELALACHRRIALDDPAVQVGCPEVNLGVIPGGGGTQRMPRLIGLQAAVEHILQAKVVRAPKAVQVGLVDELAPDRDALMERARAWVAQNPRAKQPWDREGFTWPPPAPESELGKNMVMAGAAMLYRKTAGAFPGAEEALAVIQEGARLAFDGALALERRAFARLATSGQAKDMIRTFWYHKNAAEKHEGLPQTGKGADPAIGKVAVLGAGMMGAGLAFVCAKAGYEVVVKDIRQEALEGARRHVEGQLDKGARHLDAAGRQALLDRITYTLDDNPICGTDLVIEAVVESKAVKHAVTRQLEPRLTPGTGIWASNTSALPITELAEASAHADRFLGLHFFSPVEVMPLLEIIRGAATSDETVARALAFCRRIQKIPIVVGDGYGFYTSRVFASYLMEGAQLVVDGHDPAVIEWAARSAGMVVPPLQVFDEVTIRLGKHVIDEAERYTGRILAGARALVDRMVDQAGRVGRAEGAGFYEYDGPAGKRLGIWSGLVPLAADIRQGPGPLASGVDLVAHRLLLAQCAEVARALDEGILHRFRDADVGAIFGIGFAPNTGGPLAWMQRQGLARVVADLDRLAVEQGPRFEPAPVLRRMVAAGERFYEV